MEINKCQDTNVFAYILLLFTSLKASFKYFSSHYFLKCKIMAIYRVRIGRGILESLLNEVMFKLSSLTQTK